MNTDRRIRFRNTPSPHPVRSGCIVQRMAALFVAVLFGAVAVAAPRPTTGKKPASFFMGRLKYGNNRGGDCGDVGKDLIKLVSKFLSIRVEEEKRLSPTDPEIFETPFLFMNGHNDFTLKQADIDSLRLYFEHGGFLLASGCCTNPAFPKAWKREFNRVFPGEKLKRIPYSHPIYRSFYKIDKIPCQHEKRDIYLEGLFHEGNLVAAMCSDGLCCAFAMNNNCDPGNGISPEDGKKLALNVAVYVMTH